MIEGLVSTIVPVHNRPRMVREAVRSVVEQTYRPIEVIVVDDGSTDATPAVVADLAKSSPDVRVVRQARGGPGRAREAGRLLASGEFIQYLDSDDVLLPGKFESQVAALRGDPTAGAAYGKTRFQRVGNAPSTTAWKRTGEKIQTMFPSFIVERWWDTSTPLYRRSATEAAGAWTTLSAEEDWEYDCRIASLGTTLSRVDEFVSITRENPSRRSGELEQNPALLRDRASARELICDHALQAGLTPRDPEMQHFARGLFHLARQCGAAGLEEESKRLFRLSRAASGSDRGAGLDFRSYEFLARLFGWDRMGRLAKGLDRLRAGRIGW